MTLRKREGRLRYASSPIQSAILGEINISGRLLRNARACQKYDLES